MQMKTRVLLSVVIITCICGCLFQPLKAAEAPPKSIDEEPNNTVQKEDTIGSEIHDNCPKRRRIPPVVCEAGVS